MDGKKAFKRFIKSLDKFDKIVIAYDKDGDGVSAGAIAKISLSRLGFEAETFPFDRAHIEEFIAHLAHKSATKVMIFDISAEGYPEIFTALPQTKFMVVDHHKKYGSPEGVVVIKPADLGYKKDPASYPAGKMSFDLFSEIVNISDLDWIACVSLISDVSHKHWHEFVDKVLEKRNWAKKDYYSSIPGRISALINASNSIEESRISEAMELVLGLKPREILKSDLSKLSENLWKTVRQLVGIGVKDGKRMLAGKVIIFEITSKYKIAGLVSSLLSMKNREKFVIVTQIHDKYVSVSARCQSCEIPANEILEKATKEFEDSKAGGHIPAAGAHFLKKDLNKFKKNVISEIEKYLKK